MTKLQKFLLIPAVVVQILALALGIVGTIQAWNCYYHYNFIYVLLPLLGTFFTLVGTVFLFLSKKKKGFAILTLTFNFLIALFYFLGMLHFYSGKASVLLILNFILIPTYIITGKKNMGGETAPAETAITVSAEDLDKIYEDLSQLKKLLDEGIISEEEFSIEKQKIMNF